MRSRRGAPAAALLMAGMAVVVVLVVVLGGMPQGARAAPRRRGKGAQVQQKSESACRKLGFYRAQVRCGATCSALLEVVGEDTDEAQLHTECLQCCTPDEDEAAAEELGAAADLGNKKYARAVLEADERMIFRFEAIDAFVRRDLDDFDNLEFKHVYGLQPRLALFKDDLAHVPDELIKIEQWAQHTVREFLTEHLKGAY